ncbi:MAG: choice-of-anchor D domain-containing protein [Bacteroidetes bacterium]|nr:choice-of-anchor D domain-containing protein [Bacteroidota bacterium]
MKNILQTLLLGVLTTATSLAQTAVTGPSTSTTPYIVSMVPGSTITSILTAGDVVGGYRMCGTPDGCGVFDNGNGTFTLLMNHEFVQSAGVARAHGQPGSFVSKWVINKSTLAVISGADLIQNVNIWNGSSYVTYNASSSNALATFTRFCSADLPPVTAYYNNTTGNGTPERIFMNGEESGAEGRVFGHIATGPNAGTSYELPFLGKFAPENAVACPYMSDKTIVGEMDDTSPSGQVYFYVGTKTNTGSEINKAGLVGGNLFGVAVSGMLAETTTMVPAANTTFSLINLGNVSAITGASLNTMSNNNGVTTFLRPEDGAWDPSNPRDFYFNTTDAIASPSRLWRLRFNDINNPQNGGTITAVLDGTEGQLMLDNMAIDNSGHIMLLEDVGNNSHNGIVFQYDIATDVLTQYAQHDPARFVTAGPSFLTQDEETSGVIDVQSVLGPGMFLIVDQAHFTYTTTPDVVEGGQILAFYNPTTFAANPEINIQGNSVNIVDGSTTTSAGNNTSFGTVGISFPQTKTYVIQNTGTGTLNVSGIYFNGTNASEFTLISPPTYPLLIGPSASQTLTVQFNPAAAGLRTATINISNNDYSENIYDYVIDGNAVVTTGISTNNVLSESVTLYPNPTRDEATVKVVSENSGKLNINVYDLQGRIVKSPVEKNIDKGEYLITINTADLKNGLYFVEVIASGKTTKIEMIVMH